MVSRFPALGELQLNEAQQKLVDDMSNGPRGGVGGPFKILIHRPELAQHVQSLGIQCRFGTQFSRAQSELVILLSVQSSQSDYPWHAHKKMALDAGLDPEIVRSIGDRRTPVFSDARDEAIYLLISELLDQKRISDATFNKGLSLFGIEGLIDLIILSGYYGLIAGVMNAFNYPMPDGEPPVFK